MKAVSLYVLISVIAMVLVSCLSLPSEGIVILNVMLGSGVVALLGSLLVLGEVE